MSRPDPHGDVRGDATLARAAASGDRAALEILLERHFDMVHAVCRRITGNPDDALDATQEALIALSRNIGRWDARARFTTWLYRVATNAALDELRRRKRRPAPSDPALEADPDHVPAPGGARASFEGDVDTRLDVDAALAGLSPEFRAAVVLADLCDLGYRDIAQALNIPIGTVRSRIARGRAALAEALGPERPGRAGDTGNSPGRPGRPMREDHE